jgi:hypothetical protein
VDDSDRPPRLFAIAFGPFPRLDGMERRFAIVALTLTEARTACLQKKILFGFTLCPLRAERS